MRASLNNQAVSVGNTVRVHQKIEEEGKSRTQIFEGVIIAIRGRESGKSLTVRKIAQGGIGVERTWPLISPNISKIQVVKSGRVVRGKLYYLRDRTGKQAVDVGALTAKQIKGESQTARKAR